MVWCGVDRNASEGAAAADGGRDLRETDQTGQWGWWLLAVGDCGVAAGSVAELRWIKGTGERGEVVAMILRVVVSVDG